MTAAPPNYKKNAFRKFVLIILSIMLGIIPAYILLAYAQDVWINGQDAILVIGQPDFISADSGLSDSQLYDPYDVAIDLAHGKLYIADWGNNRVLRFSYPITENMPSADLVFGQPDFNTNTHGTTINQFWRPQGLEVDSSGRLWVAELMNSRVVWFKAAYAITSNQPDADGVLGQDDFTTLQAHISQSGLYEPSDIAVAETGELFVADVRPGG